MIIKSTKHIDSFTKRKVEDFFNTKGLKNKIDYSIDKKNFEDGFILTLFNEAIELYSKIETYCFLIRLAKDKFCSKYDICENFIGTQNEFNQYIQKYDKNIYSVWHISK